MSQREERSIESLLEKREDAAYDKLGKASIVDPKSTALLTALNKTLKQISVEIRLAASSRSPSLVCHSWPMVWSIKSCRVRRTEQHHLTSVVLTTNKLLSHLDVIYDLQIDRAASHWREYWMDASSTIAQLWGKPKLSLECTTLILCFLENIPRG